MAEIITMPKLSDTMEEGVVAQWNKAEGEAIEEGELLAEIETDKATQEYESPEEGVILQIFQPAGKTLKIGTPICVIGEKGETVDLAEVQSLSSASEPAAPTVAPSQSATPAQPAAPSQPKTPEVGVSSVAEAPVSRPSSSSDRIKVSPVARKIAAQKGVDLAGVSGTGPSGRIIKADVEGYRPAAVAARGPSIPGQASEDVQIPVSMMRKTIAKRLLAAKNDAPHFYLNTSADMTRALSWRRELNREMERDSSLTKISVNDIVLLAVAKALARHPDVNSSWQGDHILQFSQVAVAVAVALPDGLVTPVIRQTDRMGVREIAAQVRELAGLAKKGKLGNEAYQDGSFTVSNLGMFGIEHFTAIINPPQGAILAVGAALPTPTCVERDGETSIEPRPIMKMTMSCDHRVIDGAVGAQFLQTLKSFLQNPLHMLS